MSVFQKVQGTRLCNPEEPQLIEMGSCCLHVIHGGFQTGHTKAGWAIGRILSAAYWFFKDSPARRGRFTKLTKSTVFPLKFCHVRWVKNVSVANCFKEISAILRIFVEKCPDKLTKEKPSFKTLSAAFEDSFFTLNSVFSLVLPLK